MYKISEIKNSSITNEPCTLPIDSIMARRCISQNVDSIHYVKKMYKNTSNDTLTMKFERTKTFKKYDRAYCEASPVSLKSTVRAGLFGDLTCIDQSSAQPRAMVSAILADDNEIAPRETFAALFHYVEHKDAERKRVADTFYNGDLKQAKELYQKLTFGASNPHPNDKQLSAYCSNLRIFACKIASENSEIVTKMKKQKAKEDGSSDINMCVLALYGRNVEQRITECAVSYMIDKNIIKNRQFASMHDGIMFVNHSNVDDVIDQVNTHVKNTLGFNVLFEHEDYTAKKKLFLDNFENYTFECDEKYRMKFCREYFLTLKSHREQKAYWELHFAYCIDQCKTAQLLARDVFLHDGTIETERKLRWFSDKELISAYGNLDHATLKNTFGDPMKFAVVWLGCSDRRQYNQVDVLPYPSHYIPGKNCTEDTYNAFVGYPKYIWGDDKQFNEDEMRRMLDPFFTMVMHLVGCKGYNSKGRFDPSKITEQDYMKFDTLMHLIGHRVMHPSDSKLPYAVLIKSIQGTGKNTLCDVIARLVGASHYKCSSNIDDFCGTHAEGFLGKLFCILNEAEISKTGKHKNVIKELISEEKGTCNVKYQRPFEYALLAMIIVLSNESCPINLDTTGKDRRWVVFEANDFCAKRWGQGVWKAMHKHFRSHDFLRALKQYFQQLDYENFDYKTAKRINNKTEAYRKVACYFYPSEVLFVQDYIEQSRYMLLSTESPFYETFDCKVSIGAKDFYDYAQAFYKDTNNETAQSKSYKSFNSALAKFNMPIEKKTTTDKSRSVVWHFNPKTLYAWLISNEYIDIETIEDNVKNALENSEQQEAELDMEELGFDI